MLNSSSNIHKPCIRQCCLDEHDVCMGCYRTLDNMRAWHSSTDKEKIEMIQMAKTRKIVYMQKRVADK